MKKSLSLLVLFLMTVLPGRVSAQIVDNIGIYSTAMNKEIKNVIILPGSYSNHPDMNYPVVYLLHGHGNNYVSWSSQIKPDLDKVASQLNLIFVCPDGAESWYWDSPVNPAYQYETYVSKELTNYIDQHYRTVKSREGRAITGYSMGGHGSLWLGFRHPDIYGACGSMSGGVDIRPFPENWNMKKMLGSYAGNPKIWDEHTVINQIPSASQYGPAAIIIDCGTDDFFYQVNLALHEKLLQQKIPHDFISRPGNHSHSYWNNAIDYQLLFFWKFFNKQK